MKFQGTVVEKSGVKFAIVKVEKHVFDVPGRARDTMISVQPAFPHMPVVFVTHDSDGTPAYYGRPDIVRLMPETELNSLEWKEFELDSASNQEPGDTY